jgi:hypothetical protein
MLELTVYCLLEDTKTLYYVPRIQYSGRAGKYLIPLYHFSENNVRILMKIYPGK